MLLSDGVTGQCGMLHVINNWKHITWQVLFSHPSLNWHIFQVHTWTFFAFIGHLPSNDDTCKSHATMDGSKHAALWLCKAVKTYHASCVDQLSMKFFFAIAAVMNKIITIADTSTAFQQSPPPTKPCFLAGDWWSIQVLVLQEIWKGHGPRKVCHSIRMHLARSSQSSCLMGMNDSRYPS